MIGLQHRQNRIVSLIIAAETSPRMQTSIGLPILLQGGNDENGIRDVYRIFEQGNISYFPAHAASRLEGFSIEISCFIIGPPKDDDRFGSCGVGGRV